MHIYITPMHRPDRTCWFTEDPPSLVHDVYLTQFWLIFNETGAVTFLELTEQGHVLLLPRVSRGDSAKGKNVVFDQSEAAKLFYN